MQSEGFYRQLLGCGEVTLLEIWTVTKFNFDNAYFSSFA